MTGKLWEPAEKPVYTQTQWSTVSTAHETGKQSSPKQSNTQNKVGKKRCTSHNTHKYVLVHTETHTLLAGFSVLLAVGSGWSCLPFFDGVLLILGEWNLSFSFIVKEDRWDRCESKSGTKKKTEEDKKTNEIIILTATRLVCECRRAPTVQRWDSK